jgi:hypothetical protein
MPAPGRTTAACKRRGNTYEDQAIGRSRGGLTTKIHALVDALGNPANLMLTAGQIHGEWLRQNHPGWPTTPKNGCDAGARIPARAASMARRFCNREVADAD